MSTATISNIRIVSPQVTALLPDDHYTIPTREVTYEYRSRWTQFVTAIAYIFAGITHAVSLVLLSATALGVVFLGVNFASAAEDIFPSIQHTRTQEVPASGNTLEG